MWKVMLLAAEITTAVLIVEVAVSMHSKLGLGKLCSEAVGVKVMLLGCASQETLMKEVRGLPLIMARQRMMLLLDIRVGVLEQVRMVIEEGLVP